MKKIANLVLMILMLCMLVPCRFVVQAEEEENEVIQATFYSVTTRKNSTIEVEFNKHWFDDKASNYSHDLAKLSLGLATSAFRPKRSENGQQDLAGKNLNDFLVAAHFEDIRSDDYDKDPSMYTISTAMGHQQIEGEDGLYELIAIGICGQGYVDEWESNFTIGDGFNHEGFEQASRLVYDRIFGYIAEKKLQGHLKIWISGFSRAAAVSNLTAAKLSDSMIFDNDDVFAYTFATPRTTTDPEPGRYLNIFNIVGKADPVPMLPFKQWGYNRYGVDLYLPSYETDSDFEAKRTKANEIYRQISGIDYWYNREVNETLHDILTFILVICPSAKLYTNSLQNKLIHIWENNDAVSIMAALLEISEDPVLINEDTRIEANELMNYLTAMIISYRNDDSIMRGWNPSASTYANIMQIHTPNLYISWVFSADSYEELYTDYDSYSIAYIESAFDVSLYRDGEYVESIPAIIDLDYETGKKNVLIKEKDRKVPEGNLYLTYYDENIAAVLPKDRDYSLRFKSEDEEKTVEVFFIEHKIYSGSENEVDYYSYDMEANDQLIVSRDEDNKWNFETDKGFKEDRFAKGEGKMSASTAIEIRKPRAYYRLTWRQAAILTIAVGLFVLSSLVFYILFAIGRIRYSIRIKNGRIAKESRYTAIPLMGSIVIVLLFLIREFYSVLFPNNRLLQTCFKLVIGLISIQIAFIGYRRERSRLSRMILYAMMLFALADIVTSYYLIPGSFLHIAAYALLSYAYIEEERPGRNQLIAFGALFILGALIASLIKGEYGMLRLMVIIYLFFVLAMVVLSFPLPRKVFTGSILIFLAGIFLIINQINGETFISHIISLGTYYAGIIILSSMGIRYKASSSGEEDENTYGSPEQTATEPK